MDESEQKPSEDIPASDSSVTSKGVVESSPESEMGNKSSTSTDSKTTTSLSSQEDSGKTSTETTDTSSQPSTQQSSGQLAEQASGDKGQDGKQGSSEPPAVQQPPEPEGSKKNESTQASKKEHSSPSEESLAGASSGPGAPPANGAVGPGGSDVMAKMMDMMAKGSASPTPKAPGDPSRSVSDMMSKGGGMPDMMAMMAKGGMPDMMAMMAEGGNMADMKAMMSKMEGGPLGMAKLFDCIIDVSLARPDSDPSDDDEDSITLEIPCQYCSRFFTSQMTLKTHILVAHEREDSSVLNLKKLVIDKGKRSVKDHHGTRRKQSKDCENLAAVEAARTDNPQHVASSINKVTSSQEDLLAAESSKGVKRGRSERRKSEAADTGEASGVEEGSLQSDQDPLVLGAGAVSSSCVPGSPPESRKRSARLRSLRSNSGDVSSQVTTKKSKSGDDKHSGDSHFAQEVSLTGQPTQPSSAVTPSGDKPPNTGDSKSHRTAKHKEIKADSKRSSPIRHSPVTRGKRLSRKDKDMASSDTDVSAETPSSEASGSVRDRSHKDRQSSSVPTASVPAASASVQGSGAASASRRSLRSRKSH